MQYLLLLHADESGWSKMTEAEQQQGYAAYMAYTEALKKAGAYVGSNRLQPVSSATTVKIANGKQQVLDGPYADAKEQLGGYLPDRSARSGCRDCVGGALPRREPRNDRGAPGVGDVGFAGVCDVSSSAGVMR